MIEYIIKAGTTSKIIMLSVYDSSSTTGAKLGGLVFNSGSLTCYYNRAGAAGAATQISLLTATKGTWTTAGFVQVDNTNMPGDYELHLPDAAIAVGATEVLIQLKGATNMVPVNIHITLTTFDLGSTTVATVTNLTNLPTATLPELSQGAPAATPTLAAAVMLLYMALRNQITTTSTVLTIANDAGTVICKSGTMTDDGTTFTRPELVTGP